MDTVAIVLLNNGLEVGFLTTGGILLAIFFYKIAWKATNHLLDKILK